MYPKSIVVSSCLLLLFSSLFDLSLSQELCNPQDKQALLQIKEHFGNPFTMAFWDPSTDCCSDWRNVYGCDDQGHVTGLTISMLFIDFHGDFPAAICELPYLQNLLITDIPNVVGPLPTCFANITNLQTISIQNTNLTGLIFPYLVANKNLSTIHLDSNGFTGHIPRSLAELGNLTNLQVYESKFTGRVPDIFNHLQKLEVVILHVTNFTGPIPKSLGLLPNLTQLILFRCLFSGKIPETFCNSNIIYLDLSFNRLKGDPTKSLFCKNNKAMLQLGLQNNSFSFDFSKSDDPPKNLVGLDLSHNMIYGSLPKRLGQWRLKSIDVSYNELCGRIPTGRRLSQMSPRQFSHNKCLCGRPLPPCTV